MKYIKKHSFQKPRFGPFNTNFLGRRRKKRRKAKQKGGEAPLKRKILIAEEETSDETRLQ